MVAFETATLVLGIVGAVNGAVTLYRSWRKDRLERREKSENRELERWMRTSGQDIQSEYNRDFQRLGDKFARGDAISRSTLQQQLIIVQSHLIGLLAGDDGYGVIHPEHQGLSYWSNSVRSGSISALSQLFQRLSQASRIPAPVSAIQRSSPNALTLYRPNNNRRTCSSKPQADYISGTFKKSSLLGYCKACGWRYNCRDGKTIFGGGDIFWYMVWSRDKLPIDVRCALSKFHYRDQNGPSRLACFKCNGKGVSFVDFADFKKHIANNHFYNEICNGRCSFRNDWFQCGHNLKLMSRSETIRNILSW